jgi:hypothetical protein
MRVPIETAVFMCLLGAGVGYLFGTQATPKPPAEKAESSCEDERDSMEDRWRACEMNLESCRSRDRP